MSTDNLFSMDCPVQERGLSRPTRDDIRLIDYASLSLLDSKALGDFLQQKMKDKPMLAHYSSVQLMHILNLSFDGIPTLAALLHFCPYPQGFFPQLAINAVVIPGVQMGDMDDAGRCFLADERIEGNISEMYRCAVAFCEQYGEGQYPMDAVRELLLNALIHRDYSNTSEGTPIHILFFNDRLEIHSPGTLYGAVSPESLGECYPDLRNPAIAAIAESLTGSRNRYSGIPVARAAMKNAELPDPVFENREGEFVATLYNKTASAQYDDIDCLLDFCKTPRSRSEIAEFLGVKTVFYVMQRYVQPLLEEGKLEMTLPDRPKSSYQKFKSKVNEQPVNL